MSTTLNDLVTELSKALDDYWEGTAVTNATNPTYTLKDTALSEKQSDWVTDGSGGGTASTVYLKTDAGGAGAAPEGEERIVNALDPATSLLTTTTLYPFTDSIANGDTYEIHRLFTRAEKERAIKYACYAAFPALFKKVIAYTRIGWIKDSNFNKWTNSTTPTYWYKSAVTATQTTSAPYILYPGSTVCALSTATGYISQRITENSELAFLAGKTLTLKAKVLASTASQVRLAIYDGTTTTYSDYHDGDGSWGDLDNPLSVSATIQDQPTAVEFRVYYNDTSTTAYIAEVWIAGMAGRKALDASLFGFYHNLPHQIHLVSDANYPEWGYTLIRNWERPTTDSMIRFRGTEVDGQLVRLQGIGHLTEPVSTYGGGTAVSTEADAPDTRIIIAEAIIYLYDLLIARSPAQDIARYEQAKARWETLAARHRIEYMMPQPWGTIHY